MTERALLLPIGAIGDPMVRELAMRGQTRTFPKNAVIINEGDRGDSLFVIGHDRVAQVFTPEGKFVRIFGGKKGKGDGEMAMVHGIAIDAQGRIYATDINKVVLERAESGIFPLSAMQEYTTNYLQSGGTGVFSDLYTAGYDSVIFDASLKKNIVFAQHNLVTDGPFNEFNVILCRNVMIYFNRALQDRVHGLMYDSLAMFGVLGLGSKETTRFTSHQGCYQELDPANRLYRKVK